MDWIRPCEGHVVLGKPELPKGGVRTEWRANGLCGAELGSAGPSGDWTEWDRVELWWGWGVDHTGAEVCV